jgi:hypothetical protein
VNTRPIDVLNRRDWQYVPASSTDLRKTFERIRKQIAQQKKGKK